MSSSDKPEIDPSTADGKSAARDIPTQPQDNVPASTPVEMNSLPSDHTIGVPAEQQTTNKSLESAQMPHLPMRTDTSTAILASQQTSASSVPPMPNASSPRSNRAYSTAIGESSDSPLPPVKDTETTGPTLMITLLLINGARHPFNLDAKYLSKRNVQTQANDPFSLSVYKLKELILREWREEWESKPSSPSAIRLIHFGKVLDDKTAVKDLKFNATSTNVVHMSIKPQDFIEEEDAKGAKASRNQSRDGGEGRSPGCRCIVM